MEPVETTEEQKAFIVDAQRKSEDAPLDEENRRNSRRAFKLLEESDDIYIAVIGTPVFESFGKDAYKYNEDLLIHYVVSLGVHGINNPAPDPPTASDDLARNYFGLSRTAVVYLKIREETGLEHPEMEELLKIGSDGVKAYLEENLSKQIDALHKSFEDFFKDHHFRK